MIIECLNKTQRRERRGANRDQHLELDNNKHTLKHNYYQLKIFRDGELIATNIQRHIDILDQHQESVMKFRRNDPDIF